VTTIPFKDDKKSDSLLRNGGVDTRGVALEDLGAQVLIRAVTSRGNVATGYVGIEVDSIPEVVGALIRMHIENRPKDEMFLRDWISAALRGARPQVPGDDAEAMEEAVGPAPRF